MPQESSRLAVIAIAGFVLLSLGCMKGDEYPNRPITLVCPWGAGGGTDRVSRLIAKHLEDDLGTPVSVINATGGKGVTGHSRGLMARPDGYTLLMATLELNMMHWNGLTELTDDDARLLMSLNEDYAALFVRNDAPWKTLAELEAHIRANPETLTASGTASGGAWHLGVAGWMLSAGMNADDVVWVPSTGAGPSLQDLMANGVDMVCCALPEAEVNYRSGEIRALGVMSPKRAIGYEEVPTFAEQGRDWALGGWRGIAVPKDTPEDIVERLKQSLEKIVSGQTSVAGTTFPQAMNDMNFDSTSRREEEFVQFVADYDKKLGELLTSPAMKSVNKSRYNAMAFPYAIIGGLMLAIGGVWTQARFAAPSSSSVAPDEGVASARGYASMAIVVIAVVGYCLFAETLGFVLLTGIILLTLLLWLGVDPLRSFVGTVVFVPAIYHLFAHVFHVALPRGWFGW